MSSFPAAPVQFWTDSHPLLEIFSEGRLGGKMQLEGYFLNTHLRIAQQYLGFEYHVVAHPFRDSLSCVFLYYAGKIVWG